jgi:hypothetical protein
VTGFYTHGTETSSLELSSCQTSILLKMKALDFSDTSGKTYPVIGYHVPKRRISQSHWRDKLEALRANCHGVTPRYNLFL